MKQKSWLRRQPRGAVLVTGILALIINALPLAALHIADMPLFSSSHERSWQNMQSVQVSGEDLYLVQALREKNQQEFYWQSEEMELSSDGFSMLNNYIGDLADAGVLDTEWLNLDSLPWEMEVYLVEQEHFLACSYMRDSAGFLTLSVWEKDSYGNEYALWEQLTLESTTGKIVSFFLTIPQAQFDLQDRLEKYITYLGLSGLDDWKADSMVEGTPDLASLYSQKAQAAVMLYTVVGDVPDAMRIVGGLEPST